MPRGACEVDTSTAHATFMDYGDSYRPESLHPLEQGRRWARGVAGEELPEASRIMPAFLCATGRGGDVPWGPQRRPPPQLCRRRCGRQRWLQTGGLRAGSSQGRQSAYEGCRGDGHGRILCPDIPRAHTNRGSMLWLSFIVTVSTWQVVFKRDLTLDTSCT